MSDDLITWLHAQLDDDERVARQLIASPGGFYLEAETAQTDLMAAGAHVVRWSPARVLAEVDAKRRILDRHGPIELFSSMYCTHCGVLGGQRARDVNWPCPEVLDAAAPYADRPGYREEWAPDAPS